MKKINLLLILVLLASLFSLNVLAEVPGLGESLSDLGDFFRGLFTGAASMENAYFISFILYFILFLAIFMEGLKTIPFFGGKGSLDKQGKFFAVAASALSTLALFVIDQGTGMSTQERVEWLVAPFGIWGGLILAGLISLITYRMVKSSDIFREETITAMAVAAAVGVTFAGFLLNLETVLGWGFLIMIIVFIVGGIRAFASHRGETEEVREADREEKASKGVEKYKEEERKKKVGEKQKHLDSVRDLLLSCIDTADEGIKHLDDAERNKAIKNMNSFYKYVRIAWRELKKQAHKEEGRERTKLEKLAATLQAIVMGFRDQAMERVRAEDWEAKKGELITVLKSYKAECGAVVKGLR
jgi:hypothetical protein